MGIYQSIDELVDEILIKNNESETNKDIKKRKPKPFRYLSEKEVASELFNQDSSISVMKNPDKNVIFNEDIFQLSMGDTKTIEDIIRKHEVSRKIR